MVAKQGQVGSSYVIKHFSRQQEIPQLTQICPFWTIALDSQSKEIFDELSHEQRGLISICYE